MPTKAINLVNKFIKKHFPEDINKITPIQGDASNRRYFRVQHEKQAVNSSIVIFQNNYDHDGIGNYYR